MKGRACLLAATLLLGCGDRAPSGRSGDAEEGRLLLRQFGCGSCHRITGVAGAQSDVGPPLDGVARRVYLAGVLPNSPENMARWIQDPQHFAPRSVMPDLQVTERQARDIVAFLQELE